MPRTLRFDILFYVPIFPDSSQKLIKGKRRAFDPIRHALTPEPPRKEKAF